MTPTKYEENSMIRLFPFSKVPEMKGFPQKFFEVSACLHFFPSILPNNDIKEILFSQLYHEQFTLWLEKNPNSFQNFMEKCALKGNKKAQIFKELLEIFLKQSINGDRKIFEKEIFQNFLSLGVRQDQGQIVEAVLHSMRWWPDLMGEERLRPFLETSFFYEYFEITKILLQAAKDRELATDMDLIRAHIALSNNKEEKQDCFGPLLKEFSIENDKDFSQTLMTFFSILDKKICQMKEFGRRALPLSDSLASFDFLLNQLKTSRFYNKENFGNCHIEIQNKNLRFKEISLLSYTMLLDYLKDLSKDPFCIKKIDLLKYEKHVEGEEESLVMLFDDDWF